MYKKNSKYRNFLKICTTTLTTRNIFHVFIELISLLKRSDAVTAAYMYIFLSFQQNFVKYFKNRHSLWVLKQPEKLIANILFIFQQPERQFDAGPGTQLKWRTTRDFITSKMEYFWCWNEYLCMHKGAEQIK